MTVTYHVGDTREVVRGIPDGSVALVATSPPFLALRSYAAADNPDKHLEIGSEPDPATFIDTLLGLTAEWLRVLAPWGSLAIELGDTYSGSGGGGGDYLPGGMREGQQQFAGSAASMRESNAAHWRAKNASRDTWPRAKSLALIPQLYAVALAYGINPLTGQPSPVGRLLVRNLVVWHRPNPAVGALGDKYRPSTSHIVIATRDPRRYFDLTAVRGEPVAPSVVRVGAASASRGISGGDSGNPDKERLSGNPNGAPPLDCWFDQYDGTHDTWTITTQPSRLAHYAMWPAKLAQRLILSMTPPAVCAVCGEPRRRVEGEPTLDAYRASDRPQTRRAVELADGAGLTDAHIQAVRAFGTSDAGKATALNDGNGKNSAEVQRLAAEAKAALGGYFREFVMSTNATITTLGWTDCGHDNYVPAVVLDPFVGSGTTLCVADVEGRDAIGIDLYATNRDLYPARHAEVVKALTGAPPPDPNQLSLLEEDR